MTGDKWREASQTCHKERWEVKKTRGERRGDVAKMMRQRKTFKRGEEEVKQGECGSEWK